jgi:hypothetical protein
VAFTVAMSIGGDGLNGYATNGHYFLYLNGKYTETSHAIFEYSKWHFISVFVTHPLAIAAGWILTFRGRAWLKSQGF